MYRERLTELLAWKAHPDRKPLLLDGVRQAGKTYLLRHFGEHHFPQAHYINFEKNSEIAKVFTPNLDPIRVINELNFQLGTTINVAEDLVIFDEIQACPAALTSLKYFQEDLPQLALCAAGSLLGLHLNSGSFPVGKVDMLTLHPLSFEEFLLAIGEDQAVNALQNLSLTSTIPELLHQKLWQQLKHYFVVGGLPEAVKVFRDHREDPFTAYTQVRQKQIELIKAYYADMAKHAGKINALHIDRLWRQIPAQLATAQDGSASKFRFKGIIEGINRYSRLANVLDWLHAVQLIMKVPIVNSGLLPFSAYTKENNFKLLLFDVGILGALGELPPKVIWDYDYGTYKGYFAENFIAQEFRCAGIERLYSWNEKTAEIEFLREHLGHVIPIEVKSGWITKAKSLAVFNDKYTPPHKVIFSAKNLFIDHQTKTHYYPLYLAKRFPLQGSENG